MLFQWADMQKGVYPELCMLFAIPNGGKRAMTTAKAMKATGTKAGVPDIELPVARGGYHGLFVELKRIKGGKVSSEQAAWLEALTAQGYCARVCKGFCEAQKLILDYIKSVITREVTP